MTESSSRRIVAYRRNAFSLIELVIVLVIISIVAGAVSMRWTYMLGPAVFDNTVDSIEHFDAQIRKYSANHQCQCVMTIDPSNRQLIVERMTEPPTRLTLGWRDVVEVEKLTLDPFDVDESLGRSESVNQPSRLSAVYFNRYGISPSYSLIVRSGKKTVKLRFAGVTGHCLRSDESN